MFKELIEFPRHVTNMFFEGIGVFNITNSNLQRNLHDCSSKSNLNNGGAAFHFYQVTACDYLKIQFRF